MSDLGGCAFIVGLFLGVCIGAFVVIVFVGDGYSKLLVECGKAHYDTVTGEFVKHEEGK